MSVYKSMYRMVFAFIVFPFLLFSLLVINFYSSKLEQVITESLQVVAEAQLTEMTNFCEQQKEYLVMTGTMDISHKAMRGELDAETMEYLDDMLHSMAQRPNSYMASLSIVNKDNRIVACSGKHDRYADDGLGRIIEDMGARTFYISDVLTDGQGNKTLVTIAKIEEEDELLGYFLAEISLDFYGKIRERAKLWSESSFYLLDGNQQIISAGTPDENRNTFVTTPKERKNYDDAYSSIDFEKNPKGSFRYKLGEKEYITYYSSVDYSNWQIMLTACLDDYMAEKAMYLMLIIFIAILCIILSIWIGHFASVRLMQPIERISNTLKDIQRKQDYSLRVEVGRRDELGILALEINELVDFIETEDMYKQREKRLLKERADQDVLTKVLNKERINQYLQEAIERKRKDKGVLAVLFVDIDDFKNFNTQYGHSTGDQVLLFIASILGETTGGVVGRVGGDEFLVVIEEEDRVRSLENCLEKTVEVTGSRFVVRGSEEQLPVFLSIGAVRICFTSGDMGFIKQEWLTDLADEAMYQAKDGGKRGYVIRDIEG